MALSDNVRFGCAIRSKADIVSPLPTSINLRGGKLGVEARVHSTTGLHAVQLADRLDGPAAALPRYFLARPIPLGALRAFTTKIFYGSCDRYAL